MENNETQPVTSEELLAEVQAEIEDGLAGDSLAAAIGHVVQLALGENQAALQREQFQLTRDLNKPAAGHPYAGGPQAVN